MYFCLLHQHHLGNPQKKLEEDDQNWERSFKQVSTPCLYICGEKCDKKLRKAHAEKKLMNINPKSKVVEIKVVIVFYSVLL